MRIEPEHMCRDCCYCTIDEFDNSSAFCCIEPNYIDIQPYQSACKFFVSDSEKDNNTYSLNEGDIEEYIFGDDSDDEIFCL